MPCSAQDPSQLQAEALYSNTKLFLNTSARHLLLLIVANPPALDEAVGDLSPSPCSGGSPCSPQRLQQWGLTPTVLFYNSRHQRLPAIDLTPPPPDQLDTCCNSGGFVQTSKTAGTLISSSPPYKTSYTSINGGSGPPCQSLGALPLCLNQWGALPLCLNQWGLYPYASISGGFALHSVNQ